ncbi:MULTISPECIES: hypothetical protein [unclassified Polaribacter]|uniref:hypothetical protein n=1 Tax=unclassified Polaribacter TaxID=196858 RepID=UPI0011BEA206|nr:MULTISPECIES: hypothetical protein [unclassified Polaribacter]TXD48148.1 hypothetical protein ES043_17980 [Polaribacter sp. IC063]TXD55584.1 hypothetical protein ES044_17920 [Polaribacter sp. IC066]
MRNFKLLYITLLFVGTYTSIAQEIATNLHTINLNDVNLKNVNIDNETINDNSIETYSGSLIVENGKLVFKSTDCTLNESGILLKSISRKKLKSKRWIKK